MKRSKKPATAMASELKAQVEAWLKAKKKDYATGLALLLQTAKDGRVPVALTRNQGSYRNLDKMNYLLCKVVGAKYKPITDPTMPDLAKIRKDKAQAEAKAAALQRVSEGRATAADVDLFQASVQDKKSNWPEVVNDAAEDLESLKKQRREKSDALAESEADQEKDLVKEIKELDTAMQAKVSFISAYVKTGKVPKVYQEKADEKPEADAASRLIKDIKNMQSKASKIRAALKKNPENQEKQSELAKLDAEIQLLQDQKKLTE